MENKRARLSKEQRLDKIINAAIEVMARDGFKQASTKEIAQLSECTEALIFKYFKTKEDILDYIVQNVFVNNDSELLNFLNKDNDFKTVLCELVHWYINEFVTKTKLYKVIVRYEYSNLEFGKFVYTERLARRLKPIVLECEKRKEKGELKSHVNCEILGDTILELLDSIKFKILFLNLNAEEVKEKYTRIMLQLAESYS